MALDANSSAGTCSGNFTQQTSSRARVDSRTCTGAFACRMSCLAAASTLSHSNPRTEHHQRQTTRARYRSKYVCHRLSSHSCKLGLLVDVGLTTVLQLSPSGWITRRVSWVVTTLACPVQIHTRLLTQKQQIACKHILSAVYKGYIILSMFFWR